MEGFVGPVAAGGVGREADAVAEQHGVRSHVLGGIEIFAEQGRRHDEGVAGVGEAFAGRAVGGELAGGIEGDAGEVAQGVGVFGVVEASQDDRAGITGVRGLGLEKRRRPNRFSFGLSAGRGFSRLSAAFRLSLLNDFFASAHVVPQIIDGAEAFRGRGRLRGPRGMAGEAIGGVASRGYRGRIRRRVSRTSGARPRAGESREDEEGHHRQLPAREKPMVPLMSAVS